MFVSINLHKGVIRETSKLNVQLTAIYWLSFFCYLFFVLLFCMNKTLYDSHKYWCMMQPKHESKMLTKSEPFQQGSALVDV